jgi:hypothetical protein
MPQSSGGVCGQVKRARSLPRGEGGALADGDGERRAYLRTGVVNGSGWRRL